MLSKELCLINLKMVEKYQLWVNRALASLISRKVRLSKDSVVCDLGTGPGFLAWELSKQFDGKVFAVDYNPEMLMIAEQQWARHTNRAKIVPLLADVHKMPFDNNTFDFVVSYSCFHHWQNPVLGLKETARITKEGGEILIIDSLPDPSGQVADVLNRLIPESEFFFLLKKAIDESYSIDRVTQFAEDAGLTSFSVSVFELDEEAMLDALELMGPNTLLPEGINAPKTSWSLNVKKQGSN